MAIMEETDVRSERDVWINEVDPGSPVVPVRVTGRHFFDANDIVPVHIAIALYVGFEDFPLFLAFEVVLEIVEASDATPALASSSRSVI